MQFFVGTEAECIALIAKLDAEFGYPSGNTSTFAVPIQHDKDVNKFLVPMKDAYSPKTKTYIPKDDFVSMTVEEKAKREEVAKEDVGVPKPKVKAK